jgi:hypothetical protein
VSEPSPRPDTPPVTGKRRSPQAGIPRWVIVGGIVAAILIVAVIVVHVAGGELGGHLSIMEH